MGDLENTLEYGGTQEGERETYGIGKRAKPVQREINRKKIFKWCYRHTTYGKFFGYIVGGSAFVPLISGLGDGGSPAFPGAEIVLIVSFIGLAVGGYYLCRLMAAVHGYYTLKNYNEITHEFDETLPRSMEIVCRLMRHNYNFITTQDVLKRVSRIHLPMRESEKTTYATFIGFQKAGFTIEETVYLERGIVLPSVLCNLGIKEFHSGKILSACRRIVDDYEN